MNIEKVKSILKELNLEYFEIDKIKETRIGYCIVFKQVENIKLQILMNRNQVKKNLYDNYKIYLLDYNYTIKLINENKNSILNKYIDTFKVLSSGVVLNIKN